MGGYTMDNELQSKINETNISEELFKKVKTKAEEEYRKIGKVACPYFGNSEVNFNAKGLDHLKFKEWKKPRGKKDQYIRLKFLPLVPRIISTTTTLQGYAEFAEKTNRLKNYGSWAEVVSKSRYYEFIYVHKEKVRLKVIVRKDGEKGEYYFFSIIPFWRTSQNKGDKILFEGNPKQD